MNVNLLVYIYIIYIYKRHLASPVTYNVGSGRLYSSEEEEQSQ